MAALLTLGLGIGVTTAMFAVVDGVCFDHSPIPTLTASCSSLRSCRVAHRPSADPSSATSRCWRGSQRGTVRAGRTFRRRNGDGRGDVPRRLARGTVGPRFFDVLRLQPVVGRFFRDEDALADATPVVVISAELWREAFGSDAAIAGRRMTIDDRVHDVIGVAPAGVALPVDDVRIWTPARLSPPLADNGRDARVELTRAIARLEPGMSTAQAEAEGTSRARSVPRPIAADMLFGKGAPVEVRVRTLTDQMTRGVRPALLLLFAGVGLLLLITCANVANLFLSRGAARERDYAVRVALGAARRRLVRETLAEALLTSALGGIVGAWIAAALVRVLPALAPADFPRLDTVHLDWRSLAFAITATLAAGTISGLPPAARSARSDLLPALRNGVGASTGPRGLTAQRMLLIAEAAFAMTLIVGAVLMGRSFVNLMRTDAGYDASQVLTARIYLPGASRGEAQTDAFITELLARIEQFPGIVAAGASNMAPFGRSTYVSAFDVAPPGRERVVARAQSYVVTPGYAEALRLRLRRGRLLAPSDASAAVQGVVVNEEFVRLFLSGTDPLGIRFEGQSGTAEIVGVVSNVLRNVLDRQPQAEMYAIAGRSASIRREIYLLVRVNGDPVRHVKQVKDVIASLRRDAAVDAIEPLTAQLSASVAQPRFAATVLMSFAALALLLASIGLYGVLSYAVTGVSARSASGARWAQRPGGILASILGEGLLLTSLGLGLGVLLAGAATRLMATLLIGVAPLDPFSFGIAAAVLLIVAIGASLIPAWRAMRIDAVRALRFE